MRTRAEVESLASAMNASVSVWPTRDAAKRAIFEYVEVFYNRQRMHSSLDYLTPVEYEEEARDLNKAQAA